MRPMLASAGTVIPLSAEWTHEIKWDGMRLLADVADGVLRLSSRNENDVTTSFPELRILAGPGMPDDMLLDGEVVALDRGLPSFSVLAERMHVQDARKALRLAAAHPVTFMVFDVLRLYGVDLTARPLAERRATLERLDLPNGPSARSARSTTNGANGAKGGNRGNSTVHVPPMYDDGPALQAAALEQGLEGVVSKRLSSRYTPGRRSPDWLKFAHRPSRSVVIGGWRLETDSSRRLGAVLVGTPTSSGLTYLGRVGSGLAGKEQDRVLAALHDLTTETSPFSDDVPRVDAQGTIWVQPSVVMDVQALGLSPQGRLRQPAYRGLRPDLSPDDLHDRG